MRIVAIGLGGAGSRIVDRLYAMDRKSSKIACVQGIAIDVDEDCLRDLGNLPDSSKLYFPPLDPELHSHRGSESPTAAIDISEIISKIQNLESGETDAIVICLGLGGSLTDVATHIISGLRSATAEPVFGLVTLPCLAEGEKRSAKAADGIDMLEPLLDGMILFDNETWYKKTAALREKILNREKGFVERLGFGKQGPDLSPQMLTYRLLNDSIVRRISLILRAGEFRADGGIDLAEIVLDSGEVLNTMKGMGFITIGYAVEQTEQNPLGFLSQWRPKGIFDEENKKKASRIVDLAKQAIYQEISTPCDMTSAHKALILVAGPTHEISMQGFMTVRKWIDRSIAGLETRSGDYPVINTKNVAIIIMLSGLENIPRLGELKEIQEHYRHPSHRRGENVTGDSGASIQNARHYGDISDEKIVLPPLKKQSSHLDEMPVLRQTGVHTVKESKTTIRRDQQMPVGEPDVELPPEVIPPVTADRGQKLDENISPSPGADERPGATGKVIMPATHTPPKNTTVRHAHIPIPQQQRMPEYNHPAGKGMAIPPVGERQAPIKHLPGITSPSQKESPRQKIERELERQRIMKTPERMKTREDEAVSPKQSPPTVIHSRHAPHNTKQVGGSTAHSGISEPLEVAGSSEKRTVIISRKKAVTIPERGPENAPVAKQEKYIPVDDLDPQEAHPEELRQITRPEEGSIDLKDPAFKARDRIFDGKTVQKGFVPLPRDSSLLKANLHLGKKNQKISGPDPDSEPTELVQDTAVPKRKKEISIKKKEDISWK